MTASGHAATESDAYQELRPLLFSIAYQELRPLLFSIAYRMVGSVAEAEDIVQETMLRTHRAVLDGAEIDSPKAYLSAVTTRLAINHLRSARVRREEYVGTWLPEPLVSDSRSDPAQQAETADSLSMAFLVLLESLSPVERAAFLLREVFAYDYAEISSVVGKSEDNCRQLVARARRHIAANQPRFDVSARQREELAEKFLAAVEIGDTDGLVEMLAADAALYGDGGGKVPAAARPLHGRDRVARTLAGWVRQYRHISYRMVPTMINGQPGALVYTGDAELMGALSLDIVDGRVLTVRSIINPDKLRHLGPVADLRRLLAGG